MLNDIIKSLLAEVSGIQDIPLTGVILPKTYRLYQRKTAPVLTFTLSRVQRTKACIFPH